MTLVFPVEMTKMYLIMEQHIYEYRLDNAGKLYPSILSPSRTTLFREADMTYPDDVVSPRKIYKTLTTRQMHGLVLAMVVLVGLVPILLTLAIDLVNTGGISWSYYVFVPVVITGYRSAPLAFFTSAEFPFFILSLVLVESIMVFLVIRKRKAPGIVSYILLALSFYLGRVKIKGMNMVGFAFILLTFMLLGMDLAGGDFGWSIITSAIFLLLALIFYVLHIVFFNDTDWKKALHL